MPQGIFAQSFPGEVRVACCDRQGLTGFFYWWPGKPAEEGALYFGRVSRFLKTLKGFFVALGTEEAGFLPEKALPDRDFLKALTGQTLPEHHPCPEGMLLPLKISRPAQNGKGPRLSGRLSAEEQSFFLTGQQSYPDFLQSGEKRRAKGPLYEAAQKYPDLPVFVDSHRLSARLKPFFGERVILKKPVFDEELAESVAKACAPALTLPAGIGISFTQTPALCAIDVDLKGLSASGQDAQQLNQALIPALVRQIRIRALAGPILIDFAGMPVKKRKNLGFALKEALAEDPAEPQFLGFTGSGLAEILRPRRALPLAEALTSPYKKALDDLHAFCHFCLSEGPAKTYRLILSPKAAACLEQDACATEEAADLLGYRIRIKTDPALSLKNPQADFSHRMRIEEYP